MIGRSLSLATLILGSLLWQAPALGDPSNIAATDWPYWRGPDRNGIADANQSPPTKWNDNQNILWKQPIPGRGHSSPTIVGDQIFLTTADEEREIQSVLCYDRKTGQPIWKTDLHKGGFTFEGRQGHVRSSMAASTVASDGERVYVNFVNDNVVYATALDLQGEICWQEKVTDFVNHQGYSSSPTVYGPLLLVSADHKGGGVVTGFDRVTGETVWSVKRAAEPNYASPIVLEIDGKDQLVFTGTSLVSSYDPLTGKLNWEVEGSTVECVTSVVTDGTHVVTSGGYPENHISVIRADGSGKMIWRNEARVYVPSMLVHDGHIFGVTDEGNVFCHSFESGTPLWEHRLRGKFSASPILVGDNIYATDERGITTIFKANPTEFVLVGQNKIAAVDVQATPAICDSRIYMRVTQEVNGQRQEMLYCIAEDE
jgi:hypothetical protein